MERKITGMCCICQGPIYGYGNNPDGAVWKTEDGKIVEFSAKTNDRCCDDCNSHYVIPGRMYLMAKNRNKKV